MGVLISMREYLIDFWKEFDYLAEDAAYLLAAYDKIVTNEETALTWSRMLKCYGEDIQYPLNDLLLEADTVADCLKMHRYTAHLLLVQCMSRHLRQMYEEQGLADDLYHNAMLDLRYKLEECKLVRGIVGTFVGSWFDRFFNLTRFAIGRLQFELIAFRKEYCRNGLVLTPESTVINVHIPRTGTPMDVESCDDAFRRAKAFYQSRGEIGEVCVFYCSSWLLYPEHRRFLSPKSNVYKFMERFDVFTSKVTPNGKDLWRLFDTDEKNPLRLPGDSSLRRAYIDYLERGGLTGTGAGVFVL